MRSVVVLALLWQTAVVLSLGAIYAPNKNNHATSTSTLPWVGTEVWSTDIKESLFSQVFTSAGQVQVYVQSSKIACGDRLVTLDENDGSQTSSASFGKCVGNSFAQQLPFVASLSNNNVDVFAINSSSLTPIMSFPSPFSFRALSSVGDHFFWFATDGDVSSTHLTKIDPRARTSTMRTIPIFSSVFAGLNHLFTIGGAYSNSNNTVYCYSAATVDVIWTVAVTGSDVINLVPAPSSDTVLFMFANYSSSLFNSATGEWIWTVRLSPENVAFGSAFRVLFVGSTVILNTEVGFAAPSNITAVDVASGKILWETVGSPIDDSSSYSCGLKSNILIGMVISPANPYLYPTYNITGLDILTGKKVLDYRLVLTGTARILNLVHCNNNDVYVSARTKQNGSDPHIVVQRISFSPHP